MQESSLILTNFLKLGKISGTTIFRHRNQRRGETNKPSLYAGETFQAITQGEETPKKSGSLVELITQNSKSEEAKMVSLQAEHWVKGEGGKEGERKKRRNHKY